jgi:pimeloyl-ACP methyl ester carboxylesterase
VVAAGRRFLSHDWSWYGELALALAADDEPDLTGIRCPVTVLTGRYDLLADPRHVLRTVGALPQARIRVLPTSHFLPLEAPDELAAELAMLVERVDAVQAATRWVSPPSYVPPVAAVRAPRPRTAPEATWPSTVR